MNNFLILSSGKKSSAAPRTKNNFSNSIKCSLMCLIEIKGGAERWREAKTLPPNQQICFRTSRSDVINYIRLSRRATWCRLVGFISVQMSAQQSPQTTSIRLIWAYHNIYPMLSVNNGRQAKTKPEDLIQHVSRFRQRASVGGFYDLALPAAHQVKSLNMKYDLRCNSSSDI